MIRAKIMKVLYDGVEVLIEKTLGTSWSLRGVVKPWHSHGRGGPWHSRTVEELMGSAVGPAKAGDVTFVLQPICAVVRFVPAAQSPAARTKKAE